MDPNQLTHPGSHGNPGSHLQFQISLLRLMSQKLMGQKRGGEEAGSKVEPSVAELERLQHARPAYVRLQSDR